MPVNAIRALALALVAAGGCAASAPSQAASALPSAPVSAESLTQRVERLEGLVAALTAGGVAKAASSGSLSYAVNCSAGDTITKVLESISGTVGPVTITVSGHCNERIVISRDDVTLLGGAASAILDGAGLTGTDPLVTVTGARRVVVDGFTMWPSDLDGVRLRAGSQAELRGCKVEGVATGVAATELSTLRLNEVTVRDGTGACVGIIDGAAEIHDSTLSSCFEGVHIRRGSAEIAGSDISDQSEFGVHVYGNATAFVTDSKIHDNHNDGMHVLIDASVLVGERSVIAGNKGYGIRGLQRASIFLSTDLVIEDNKHAGVRLDGGSIVWAAKPTTIQRNGGNGIEAFDTSSVWAFIGTGPTIRDNSGWGVWCQPGPADDARIRAEGFPATTVFGNAAGQVSCPGHMLP